MAMEITKEKLRAIGLSVFSDPYCCLVRLLNTKDMKLDNLLTTWSLLHSSIVTWLSVWCSGSYRRNEQAGRCDL
jgi:hypothetical protein